jgi:hypothetical protein
MATEHVNRCDRCHQVCLQAFANSRAMLCPRCALHHASDCIRAGKPVHLRLVQHVHATAAVPSRNGAKVGTSFAYDRRVMKDGTPVVRQLKVVARG